MRTIYDMYPTLIGHSKKYKKRYIIVFIKNNKIYVKYDNTYYGYEYTNFDTIIICLRKSGIILKFIDKSNKEL